MKIERLSINGQEQRIDDQKNLTPRGNGAFESFRVHEGKAFLLDEHFDRLGKSLNALAVYWDDDRGRYKAWIRELCHDLPSGKDAFTRLIVSGDNSQSTTTIQVGYVPYFSPKSFNAIVLDNQKLIKPEYFSKVGFRIKSLSYINALAKKRKLASLVDKQEGILLTPDGYVAEGLSSNIFWTAKGKLYTPPLKLGILAGTMRGYIAKNNKVDESLAKIETLKSADEIILSSGASYLRPLSKLNGETKPGADGPMFKKLFEQLQKDVDATEPL